MSAGQPKSILKKTRQVFPPPDDTATLSAAPPSPQTASPQTGRRVPTEAARQIALSHAHSLQIRKAIEQSIFGSVEALVDYPDPTSTTLDFKCHLRFFQPSDFDSVMEEREICGKCCYPLCDKPRKRLPAKVQSKYVLVDKGKESMRFVEARKLQRFCGDKCARRGLWIRVQLSKEPAWTREGVTEGVEVDEKGVVSGLDLLGERWRGLPAEIEKISLLEETKLEMETPKWTNTKEEDLKKLAEELHEVGISLTSGEPLKGEAPVPVNIQERKADEGAAKAPDPISTGESDDRLLAIEGYTPRKWHGEE